MQDKLLGSQPNMNMIAYMEEITKLVKDLTGYDSVMIYRFAANWDGEVIAQQHIEAAPSYLGIHFPASDIPVQARRLFTKNLVRVIVDVDATPTAILPTLNPLNQQPLDLSNSAIRSSSPIHLQYLINMGVKASMSISLLQNDQLWGLISCHHLSAKRASFALRKAALFISKMISRHLTTSEMYENEKINNRALALNANFLLSIINTPIIDLLQEQQRTIMKLVDASGLIVLIQGKRYEFGLVPTAKDIDTLLAWLIDQNKIDCFHCDQLSATFPSAYDYKDIVSGLITTSLSNDHQNAIIWLRKEKIQTIQWAGDYASGLNQSVEGNYFLNPRQSFGIWTELWEGRSEPWALNEINIISLVGKTFTEGLAQKHQAQRLEYDRNQLQQLNAVISIERKEALNRLHKIASRLPGVIYQFRLRPDGHSSFPYASDNLIDIYRLTPNEISVDASKVFATIHPEDLEGVNFSIEESAKNLTPWNHEYRVKFDDGEERWLYGQSLPEQEIDGAVLWHGFITDITDRKASDNLLRMTSLALQAIKQGVLITDSNQNILWSNDAFELITGYKQTDIIEQNCRILQGPLTDSLTISTIRQALKNNETFSGEILNYRKDGSIFWNELTISSVMDSQNRLINFISTTRDVSYRKQLEMKLHESNELNLSILNSFNAKIAVLNYQGQILTTNNAWHDCAVTDRFNFIEDIENINYLDIFGKIVKQTDAFKLDLAQQGIAAILAGEQEVMYLEFPCHNEHQMTWFQMTALSLKGLSKGAVISIEDITERKQAQLALADGQALAEEASKIKSQFLAIMSHEIRTPLNALLGSIDLLSDTTMYDNQRNYLQIAKTSGDSLMQLVNDILDLTKVDSGKLELEKTPFNAMQIIIDLINLMRVGIRDKNIALEYELQSNVSPWIQGDPWRFRQVLLNLISNAIKFTDNGNITIKISGRSIETNDGVLLIEVIDTGIGISTDVQGKLFDLFVQADPSDTRKYGGSGLGLNISKRLVELWGGHMGLESQIGIGSRFWFTCGEPVENDSSNLAASANEDQSDFEVSTRVAEILLVEDSIINQMVLAAMLRDAGHQVDVADCGTASIQAVATKSYDIIFMDVSMPDMTGMEATQYIRQLGGSAAIVPIIAITAHALKGYHEQCLASGMNGYATKPINKEDLLNLVQIWCSDKSTTAMPDTINTI